ncbi:MAG TPA: tRNA-binding protein [Actinobacteria bacterium]|nr:tRNA-binding protein [bacterium BMS3Bbin01]HDH24573.1 tRNA-binding protein [Actinomycetota bacterium]
MATYRDWEALQVRIGTVVRAEPNTTARNPSYRMWIEFGELGVLQSSAKLTDHYTPDDLVDRQVVAVTGFEPMRVGGFRSDVLVLGAMSPGGVVLLRPDRHVAEGTVVA